MGADMLVMHSSYNNPMAWEMPKANIRLPHRAHQKKCRGLCHSCISCKMALTYDPHDVGDDWGVI